MFSLRLLLLILLFSGLVFGFYLVQRFLVVRKSGQHSWTLSNTIVATLLSARWALVVVLGIITCLVPDAGPLFGLASAPWLLSVAFVIHSLGVIPEVFSSPNLSLPLSVALFTILTIILDSCFLKLCTWIWARYRNNSNNGSQPA